MTTLPMQKTLETIIKDQKESVYFDSIGAALAQSKAVDRNGNLLTVWHGVKNPDIYAVDGRVIMSPKFKKFKTTGGIEPGAWFSTDKKFAAKYGEPVAFHLNIKNPIQHESPLKSVPTGHDAVYRIHGKGDGIADALEIAVFSPDQIFLADPIPPGAIKLSEDHHGFDSLDPYATFEILPLSMFDDIDAGAHQAATSPRNDLPEPTDAQKIAGNYRTGKVSISGLTISIENPEGSTRSGVDSDGNAWSNTMQHHYGYVNGSHGADGDHVDVFVVPGTPEDYAGPVFVIDQINPDTGEFDEHKCVIGADDEDSAVAAYLANYDDGWLGMGGVTELPFAAFKSWVLDGKKRGPLGSLPGYDAIGLPAPSMSGLLKSIIGFSGSRSDAQMLAIQLGIRLPSNQADVDLFGEPGGDLFGESDEQPPSMPILEVPLHELGLSTDVPQFKSGADDETGVVEPLGGKFDRTGVAPIQVWKRRDGRMEVISGRHRLDLARRSGERTIPAQVHHEDRGFDARKAAMLDAELNIRDGQGKVKDYVDYFTHSGITEADAEAKGLLARSIGQRAFAIATQGSEDLIAAHRADILSDQAAADIAALAPGNAAMQAVGIRAIQDGRPIQTAVNTMRAVIALARESGQGVDTMDLFGFDDSALKEAEAMARIASRKQRQINEQLAAIKGAAKRPELARKQGVAVEDPNAVRARVIELTALKHRWDTWSSHSDLLQEIRGEMAVKGGFDSMSDPVSTNYSIIRVATDDIAIDPQAYQWRRNVGDDGTENHRTVDESKLWVDAKMPPFVLHERNDGILYLVDGHHRLSIARYWDVPSVRAIVLRESEGYTVPAMRVLCGMLNLRKEALVQDKEALPVIALAESAEFIQRAVEREMGW